MYKNTKSTSRTSVYRTPAKNVRNLKNRHSPTTSPELSLFSKTDGALETALAAALKNAKKKK